MEVKDFIKQLVDSKKKFAEEGKKVIKLALAEAFAKNPKLRVISWIQFTPYWNDGEECIFSVQDPEFTNGTAEDLEGDGDWEDADEEEVKDSDIWTITASDLRGNHKKLQGIDDEKSIKLVDELITHGEMSDIMQDIFDDHARIFAFRSGKIEVQEYEHE